MTRQQLLHHIEKLYERGLTIIAAKNADYAADQDAFKNFRSAEVVGVAPDRAILVRVMDKLSRVGNLLDKEADVKDESVDDTILDAINYLAILHAYLVDGSWEGGEGENRR